MMILNENDSDVEGDVYIEPPDVNELTDADSGNDDEPELLKPASLLGNQLCAQASLRRKKRGKKHLSRIQFRGRGRLPSSL